jgi:hypothetical protein
MKQKLNFIDYCGVDLQLTLLSTKTGMKDFFLSPGPWNVKEISEQQLETITNHFQWSCEML